MKRILFAGALALALPTVAQAQNIGEESGWQFDTANDRAVASNIAQLIELQRNGALSIGMGGGGGGGGIPGASAANTNNYFQFVDQSQVTNNCTSSSGAVGSPISCGGGAGNSISGTTLNSSGNSNDSSTAVRDNTFNSTGNTTNNQANVGDTISAPTNGNR